MKKAKERENLNKRFKRKAKEVSCSAPKAVRVYNSGKYISAV
jgi:hypothetical protein